LRYRLAVSDNNNKPNEQKMNDTNNTYFSWTTHKNSEGNYRARVTINLVHADALPNGRHVESATFWEVDGWTTRPRARAAAIKARRWAGRITARRMAKAGIVFGSLFSLLHGS
jgi:hypothetical protein